MKQMDEGFRKLKETMDSGFKKLSETLYSGSKSVKEPVNQKIEDSSKGIENKEGKSVLLSEKKHNRNKGNMNHVEVNIKGVKNTIIKKTKKIGKICKKELIKKREELEMMKNGIINVLNLPITDHTEIMNFKDCRRTSKEILERAHNKTVSKNLRKSIFKWNIPKIERYNKMSVRSSIMNIPLKYSFSKLDDKVIEIGLETSENL